MNLTGKIRAARPEFLANLLSNPEVLSLVVPAGCEIGAKTGDSIAFVVRRKVGPLAVTLPGTVTVLRPAEGPGLVLRIQAAHLIGGKANVSLSLTPQVGAQGARFLQWSGVLETHGLVSRLMEGRDEQVNAGIHGFFTRLRARGDKPVGGGPQDAPNPGADGQGSNRHGAGKPGPVKLGLDKPGPQRRPGAPNAGKRAKPD